MTIKRLAGLVVLLASAGLLVFVAVQCSTPDPTPDDEQIERPTSDSPDPTAEEDERTEPEQPEQLLHLTFANVGQAHALLIQKDDLDILVDTGDHYTGGLPEAMESVTEPLEYMVITHPHFDHYGGADSVLNEFEVEQVITNGERRGPPRDDELPSTWNDFTTAVNEADLELEAWDAGEEIELTDHLTIEVLASGGDFPNTDDGTDINNDSLVLMVEYADRRILLPGDIEADGGELLVNRHCSDGISGCENEIADCPALDADVMKVPHHGSHHFCHSFFEAVNPEVSVFGAPHDNRQHYHPRKETVRALVDLDSRIKSTNQGGGKNVELTISPDGKRDWNVDDPEIFVWPEHGAEEGKVCEIVAVKSGGVEKECEVY